MLPLAVCWQASLQLHAGGYEIICLSHPSVPCSPFTYVYGILQASTDRVCPKLFFSHESSYFTRRKLISCSYVLVIEWCWLALVSGLQTQRQQLANAGCLTSKAVLLKFQLFLPHQPRCFMAHCTTLSKTHRECLDFHSHSTMGANPGSSKQWQGRCFFKWILFYPRWQHPFHLLTWS